MMLRGWRECGSIHAICLTAHHLARSFLPVLVKIDRQRRALGAFHRCLESLIQLLFNACLDLPTESHGRGSLAIHPEIESCYACGMLRTSFDHLYQVRRDLWR